METKTKRLDEWFKQLPSDIQERALYNTKYPDSGTESLSTAIGGGFVWEKTPEGFDYWQAVRSGNYDRARALLKENQSPPSPDLREQLTDDDGFDTVAWIKSTGRDPMSVSIEAYRPLGELAEQHREQLDEAVKKYNQLLQEVEEFKTTLFKSESKRIQSELKLDEAVKLLKKYQVLNLGSTMSKPNYDLYNEISEFLSKVK